MTLITTFSIFTSLSANDNNSLPAGYPNTPRSKTCINTNWQFHLGDLEGAESAELQTSEWETVHLPHTLKLTSLALDHVTDDKTQPTFHRQIAWYRRTIPVTNPDKVFLEFEGAHQVTDLWVNGQHAGQHAVGGYTPFHFDISRLVKPGKNTIAIRLDNRKREDTPPDPGPFDYIKFSGLYRDVYLVQTGKLHVTFPWEDFYAGVFVTTPTVDPLNMNATINVRTTVRNENTEAVKCSLLTRIIDREGYVVLSMKTQKTIQANSDYTFSQTDGIEENLQLWHPDNPYLYRVNTLVFEGDRPVDCLENPLGIRKFELNKHDGFLINGKPFKMIGANRHQHYPYIGDALPNSLHYKDVWQFKQIGFNTIRTAHYPQDNALLEACDELGILCYEEPPTWIAIGNDAWFDNLEIAARVMVRNHRNHPSVVIWGAGINHRGYVPSLHYATKEEDPTRWTGSNNSEWTGWQTSGVCDLYTNMDYDGIKDWSENEYLFAMEGGGYQRTVARYKSDPLRIGLTSWTAHAYYTFHPSRNPDNRMRGGMMDGFRTPRTRHKWYAAEMNSAPLVVIADQWKAGTERVCIYSNCEKVELLVNGVSIGIQDRNKSPKYEALNAPEFEFDIKQFEAGKLEAKGYMGGVEVAGDQVRTPGKAHAIKLYCDMAGREFYADGSDIVVAYASIVDKNGTVIRDADKKVHFTVKGPASIVGDNKLPDANPNNTRRGVAAALIRAGLKAGKIKLTAKADDLKSASTEIKSLSYNPNVISQTAGPIFDLEKLRVDLGEEGQLNQFGWIPWIGEDNKKSIKTFTQMGGFKASIDVATADGAAHWLGEMNVKGFHGFVAGEGVCGVDPEGLELTIEGLKAGRYSIKSFHHAPRSNTNSMDPNRERLKSLKLNEIPTAKRVLASVQSSKMAAKVSMGKQLPEDGASFTEIVFESDGKNPVTVLYTDPDGMHGIWLNGFELMEMK